MLTVGEDDIEYVVDREYRKTRMPPAKREDLSPADQVIFDRLTATEGDTGEYREDQRSNYFRMLLNNPAVVSQLRGYGTAPPPLPERYVGQEPDATGGIPPAAMANFLLVVISVEAPCHFLLIGHIPDAIASGVRPEAVRAILDRDYTSLTAEEQLVCGSARQIFHRTLTDDNYAKLEKLLGRRELVAFIVRTSNFSASIQIFSALGIPEPSRAQVEKVYAVAERLNRTGKPGLGIDKWPGDKVRT